MKVGGFDERIRWASCEDYDLWFRIARHFELAFIDSPLACYRIHSTNASKKKLGMLEAELYVVRKALSNDPALQARIGRCEVRDRLFELYFSIGYLYHDKSTSTEARYFLSEALRQHWTDPVCLGPVLGEQVSSQLCACPEIHKTARWPVSAKEAPLGAGKPVIYRPLVDLLKNTTRLRDRRCPFFLAFSKAGRIKNILTDLGEMISHGSFIELIPESTSRHSVIIACPNQPPPSEPVV